MNGRGVFVGNIPYDATEQQLRDLFGQAGEVTNFRLVHDRDTGNPKGYGFCEYKDKETAQSAIRNLANAEFHGRPLRVNALDDDKPPGAYERDKDERQQQRQSSAPGTNPPPDIVGKLVRSMTREQLIEILVEMKTFINKDPEGAKALLLESPAVAQAFLQIQVLFNMVKAEEFNAVNQQSKQQANRAPPQQMVPPTMQMMPQTVIVQQPMQSMQMQSGIQMQQMQMQQMQMMQPGMVQVVQRPLQTAPQQQPPPAPSALQAHQQKILQKVLQMGDAEIAKLDPQMQAAVRQVKMQVGSR